MFVQALAEYADQYLAEQLGDEAWEEKPVPWLVEVSADGAFLGVVSRTEEKRRGKKMVAVPQQLAVPRSPVNRNSGLHPLLAVDDIKYVLGPGAWTADKDRQNHAERHQAFIALTKEAAKITGDEGLLACSRFYERAEEVEKARSALKEAAPGVLVALAHGGALVQREAVRRYWRDHYAGKYSERVDAGGTGECLISGKIGPIAPTHEKIKGTASLGGQASGVSLMSFDKEAFRSYGWEQNQNGPVSPDRAMAYVLALNDLLKVDRGRRKDIAGIGFVYWLRRPEEFDPFKILEQASEEQVSALLSLQSISGIDANQFYMAGISGNGGRLRVRYWLADTLAQIKSNMADWFSGLRVAGFNDSAGPVRLWQLCQAIHRDGEPPPGRIIELVRRALEGVKQPLGYAILGAALRPLRRAGSSNAARLGLVRLCVNDIIHVSGKGDKPMTESLDTGQQHPAYLCGRLLAIFESLQFATFRGESQPNVTVADRYYSLASTYPALAFPKLENLSRKHLGKLRRKTGGAATRLEQQIQELSAQIAGAAGYRYPAILSLDGQGRFALGYHHQKAEGFAQARLAKAAKAGEGPERVGTTETEEVAE